MEALGVVDGVDEDTDGTSCVFDILEAAAVDFFGLEGFHETLGFGIVVRIAGPAHADGNIMAGEALAIIVRRILDTAIGMMNETGGLGLAIGKRLIQRFHGKRGIEMGSQRPAHDLAREAVENDGEIGEGLAQANVSDIRHPDLVRPRRHQAAQQIRHNEEGVAAVRGGWGKRLAAHRDEVVLVHKPLNPLGIYNHARTPEDCGNAPIAIESVA